MDGQSRRSEIIKILSQAKGPVSATALAKTFGVSRQIIVQDIALIRASGTDITSLSRGYVVSDAKKCSRVFKTLHTQADVEDELCIIIDAGGVVEDVFIYHRSYGMVRAKMNIKSRVDIAEFISSLSSGNSSLLSGATSGYHYHTVLADNEKTLDYIEKKLNDRGFLAPLLDHEPPELKRN